MKIELKLKRQSKRQHKLKPQETQLRPTKPATRLEVSQGYQTCYHSIW